MSDPGDLPTSTESAQGIKALLSPDDPRLVVAGRAEQAGISIEWNTESSWSDDLEQEEEEEETVYLIVKIPNGREKRPIYLDRDDAENFLTTDFENVRFLGHYEAVQLTDAGTIEARLRMPSIAALLDQLPGVKILDDKPSSYVEDDDGQSASGSLSSESISSDSAWSLHFQSSPGISWTAEMGTPTDRFLGLQPEYHRWYPTLKIHGVNPTHHDDAVHALETVADAILFDIEIRYGVLVMLMSSRLGPRPFRSRRAMRRTEPPTLPRFKYQRDAISLYFYARSARGMPLLQYLAYYQVLEYYFPSYARRELLERLRNQLKDASFSTEEDAHLGRLVGIVHRYGQGYGNEREQLKATIRACVEEDELRLFVTEDSTVEQYFTGSQVIKGLRKLNLNDKASDIRDQAAVRIYDLRCRIVHTKDESTDLAPELLLPFSAEADSIFQDIELLKFLTQKVLSASAQPMTL